MNWRASVTSYSAGGQLEEWPFFRQTLTNRHEPGLRNSGHKFQIVLLFA
jgi:hypothetical protein